MSHPSEARDAVGQHYDSGGLPNRVLQAIQNIHGNSQTLNWAELAPIDQFHVRGLAATKEMAEALDLCAGATLLDIGCGLGGSAPVAAKLGLRRITLSSLGWRNSAFQAHAGEHLPAAHFGPACGF